VKVINHFGDEVLKVYPLSRHSIQAISSIPFTSRAPAVGIDHSPDGADHMAGGGGPERLKGPVSKTGVGVARFGVIDPTHPGSHFAA
jgi:hypothetical protein